MQMSASERAIAELAGWLEIDPQKHALRPLPGPRADVGWSLSGGRALTAYSGQPPGDVAARLTALAFVLEVLTGLVGTAVSRAGPRLLSEREALCRVRHVPAPGRSLRGNARMLRTRGGWLAATLARPADATLLPALTEGAVSEGDVEGLVDWASRQSLDMVSSAAISWGLAAAAIPRAGASTITRPWLESGGERLDRPPGRRLVVADLSTLWAGPLAASLLGDAGADVMRVESASRPTHVNDVDSRFFIRLNGSKDRVVLDFDDRRELDRVVASADVVVLSARQRAIAQLGLRRRPGQLWVVITGYGADSGSAHRTGFGDDAAAAAGAVSWQDGAPNFCADAMADPITGLLAAVVAAGLIARRRACRVDVSLRDAARWAISGERQGLSGTER